MRASTYLVPGFLALVSLASCSKQETEDGTAQAPSSVALSTPPAAPSISSKSEPEANPAPITPAASPATALAATPVAVAAPPVPTAATQPAPKLELDLAKRSGCLACHSIEKKVVGPAWNDVSKRYAGDSAARSRLLEKVKKGGKGNWLEVTGGATMPPYSPRVSDADIETLVDFVLGLQAKS